MKYEAKTYESKLKELEEINRWTDNLMILRLKNKLGWTIAHAQARRGWTTKDKDVLKWATKHGYTVAHVQAFKWGEISNFDNEILDMKTTEPWLPQGKKLIMQPVTVRQMQNLGS
tara:strand:+ start:80 stop:424 length:345 start_codon:yes stop_codon:yes gene_type:complete